MKRCDKKAQVWYFTSVILVFIGFTFFGLLILANNSITGNVISDVNVPSSCSDSAISQIWGDIFLESSTGILIVKNDTTFAGKCAEYFAYKIDSNNENLSYSLHGFTIAESGDNNSYIFAERINSSTYSNLLSGINSISDVSSLPTKDSSFLSNNVLSRQGITPTTSNANSIFNKSFDLVVSQNWVDDTYLGLSSISFLNNLSNSSNEIFSQGQISVNYDYSSFGYISTPIKQNTCEESLTCEDWSNCINGTQNRTCLEVVCENGEEVLGNIFENQTCTQGSCVLNWSAGNWSSCINGTQTRTVVDLNNCGTNSSKPSANRSCVAGCTPDWECTGWYPIICPSIGFQNRNCTDNNACDADNLVKSETQSCETSLDSTSQTPSTSNSGASSNSSSNLLFIVLIIIVVLIIIGLIVWLIFSLKQKNNEEKLKSESSKGPVLPSSKMPFARKIYSPTKKIIPQRFRRQISTKNFANPIAKIPQRPVDNKFPKINENSFSKIQTKSIDRFEQKPVLKKDITQKFARPVNPNVSKPKTSKDVWNSLRSIGGLSSRNKKNK